MISNLFPLSDSVTNQTHSLPIRISCLQIIHWIIYTKEIHPKGLSASLFAFTDPYLLSTMFMCRLPNHTTLFQLPTCMSESKLLFQLFSRGKTNHELGIANLFASEMWSLASCLEVDNIHPERTSRSVTKLTTVTGLAVSLTKRQILFQLCTVGIMLNYNTGVRSLLFSNLAEAPRNGLDTVRLKFFSGSWSPEALPGQPISLLQSVRPQHLAYIHQAVLWLHCNAMVLGAVSPLLCWADDESEDPPRQAQHTHQKHIVDFERQYIHRT